MSRTDSNCIFCKIVAKQIPASLVYEDEETLAFMDIGQVNPGHALVALKAHAENVFGLDDAQASAVFRTTCCLRAAGRNPLPGERKSGPADGLSLSYARAATVGKRWNGPCVADEESTTRKARGIRRQNSWKLKSLSSYPFQGE
jgi:hypothetical protein